MNWALALGALAPGRLPARFAMILSAGVLTLYITLGFKDGDPAWVYPLRGVLRICAAAGGLHGDAYRAGPEITCSCPTRLISPPD